MAVGGGDNPRIAASALNLDRMFGSLSGGAFAVERRTHSGGWIRVGTFATPKEAADFLDEAVGAGRGTLHDYEIEFVPRKDWLRFGARAWVAALLLLFALIVASYVLAR